MRQQPKPKGYLYIFALAVICYREYFYRSAIPTFLHHMSAFAFLIRGLFMNNYSKRVYQLSSSSFCIRSAGNTHDVERDEVCIKRAE